MWQGCGRTVAADVAEDLGIIRRGAEVHRHLNTAADEPQRPIDDLRTSTATTNAAAACSTSSSSSSASCRSLTSLYPDLAGARNGDRRSGCVHACPRGGEGWREGAGRDSRWEERGERGRHGQAGARVCLARRREREGVGELQLCCMHVGSIFSAPETASFGVVPTAKCVAHPNSA